MTSRKFVILAALCSLAVAACAVGGLYDQREATEKLKEQLKAKNPEVGHFYELLNAASGNPEASKAYLDALKAQFPKPTTKEEAFITLGKIMAEGVFPWDYTIMPTYSMEWVDGKLMGSIIPIIDTVPPDFPDIPGLPDDSDLWLVVKSGFVRIASDIVIADIPASSFSVLGGGRIIEVLDISDVFAADVFILSEKFQNDLGISEFFSLKLRFHHSPTLLLDKEAMGAVEEYRRMAVRIIGLQDNPHQWDSLLNLTKAFYYGAGYYFFQGEDRPSKDGSTLTRFLSLAERNAGTQREIGFYADKLCLTAKYLSRLVKEKTGRTAKEIIQNYVSLQARTMLLSTDLTVQQISDALHFPSQSVFGKFFKKATGLSPREYRNRLK